MPVSEDMLVPIEERPKLKNHASKVEKAAFEVFLEEFKDVQLRRNGKPHCLVFGSPFGFLCETGDGSKLHMPNCNSPAKIRGGTTMVESSVHYVKKEYTSLDGRVYEAIERIDDGSIIKRFEKTPVPLSLELESPMEGRRGAGISRAGPEGMHLQLPDLSLSLTVRR